MRVERDCLDDLALGAVFLATGGGGDPHVAKLIAEQALAEYGPVELLPPTQLADDAFVVALGGVGASSPTRVIPSGHALSVMTWSLRA